MGSYTPHHFAGRQVASHDRTVSGIGLSESAGLIVQSKSTLPCRGIGAMAGKAMIGQNGTNVPGKLDGFLRSDGSDI